MSDWRLETAPRPSGAATPPPARPLEDIPVVRIRPSRGRVSLHLEDLWEYRELVYFLTWRDIKARYTQTVLGIAWAVMQPLFTMVVFSLFFGRVARMPSDGIPYPIFSFTALVPWTFFANGMNLVANSLVSSGEMIKKVYFPRLVIPLAAVSGSLVDFALAFAVLLGMMFAFGIAPTARLLSVPFFVMLALVTSLGVGVWFATLNVQYRDVRHLVPFVTQLWLFATPVAYPSSLIPEPWRTLYAINPMVGVVEGFRWALLGARSAPGSAVAVSATMSLLVLVGGLFYLRRMEKTFADVI